MKLEIFNKYTGAIVTSPRDYYVAADGVVWKDNYRSVESSAMVAVLEDFLEECPRLTWRMVDE